MKKSNLGIKARIQTGVIFLFMIIFPISLISQTPTTQDCLAAIAVCDYIYVEDSTAAGYGAFFEIPYGGNGCPTGHCMDGEKNSRWYIWTVIESGTLRFQITPQVQTDDYDWAVFNLTTYDCEHIYSHPGWMMVSCNAAGGPGYQGTTGISTLHGGTLACNNGGSTNKWSSDLPVVEGETYALCISDWTQTPGGYTLDFTSSTAVIFDDQKPYIELIYEDDIIECGTNEVSFRFNENVKCSSIGYQDFILYGPGGPYTSDSLFGNNCEQGGTGEKEFTLYFSPPIYQAGEYRLKIKSLSFISDACNNFATPDTYPFDVDLDSPDADAGEDTDVPYAGTTNLDGDASGGSGSYGYHWEPAGMLIDADIPTPTTISMTATTEFILTVTDESSSCRGEDTVLVTVIGGPLDVNIGASTTEICEGEIVNLFAYPNGGSGSYTYTWTSNPSGFNSNLKDPSDFPVQTTTYYLEVNDGITITNNEILITVNPKPSGYAGPDQTINVGTSTTLDGSGSGGTGDFTYYWEPASYLVQNDIPNPQTVVLTDPTVFILIIEDEKGCTAEPDDVLVNTEGTNLAALPWADPPEICVGEQVTISSNATGGGGEYTYKWTSDPPGLNSDDAGFVVSPGVTTRYDLILKDQYGNEVAGHVVVTVNPLPSIDLMPDEGYPIGQDTISVCVRDSVLLDAGQDNDPPGTIYFWDNNYEGRYYKATTNGNWLDWQTHTVQVKNGTTFCENTATITILFDFNQCAIGVPETIMRLEEAVELHPNPNNGTFNIFVKEDIADLEIKIFDISGRLVFEYHWIGNHPKGESASVDTDGLEKGLYIVHLGSGSRNVVKRMIIQ